MKRRKVNIKIESPSLNADITMPEQKSFEYLKKIHKNIKTGIKVTTKIV